MEFATKRIDKVGEKMKVAPIIRRGFVEGVKSSFDPSAIGSNSIWSARNVRSDDSGILRIRRGSEPIGYMNGIGKVQGFKPLFGGFLVVWNRGVYWYDRNGNERVVTGTTVGENTEEYVTIIQWSRGGDEIAYILAGNGLFETDGYTVKLVVPYDNASGENENMLMKYNSDGTKAKTQDLDSGVSKSKFGILRASLSQRLAVGGSSSSPNTVYMSSPLDATYFPSDQILQLPDDGKKITALMNWNNALIIFRDKDIWAFFGSGLNDMSASLVLQDGSVGCVEPRTIVDVPNVGLVFLGADNIYTLRGVTGVENQAKAVPIGDDIHKFIKENTLYFLDACAVYYDRQYRLSLPNAITDEKAFVLSLKNNLSWYPDTAPQVNHFAVLDNQIYGTKYNTNRIIKLETGLTDEGEMIPFHVSFRREELQGMARIKKVYLYIMSKGTKEEESLHFFGEGFGSSGFNIDVSEDVTLLTGTDQNLDISLVVDGKEVTIEEFKVYSGRLNHEQLANSEPIKIYEARFRPSIKGTFIQVRVNATSPEQDISVFGYGIEYSPSGRIKSNQIIHV